MTETAPMMWKTCIRYPAYEVSEAGDVRRNVKRLRGWIDYDGYIRYTLLSPSGIKCSERAHRLVAEAFIGPSPTPRHEVAHANGSRLFNHFTNLRWATRKENYADMHIHGTVLLGKFNGRAKLTEADVLEIRRRYRLIKLRLDEQRVSALAAEFGIHHGSLCRIVKGDGWKHIPLSPEPPVSTADAPFHLPADA